MDDCIFCKIIKGEAPCFKVYEDEKVVAFEDINPATEGHTLIVPKEHAENLYEISPESLAAVHVASRKVIHGIRKALNPVGVVAVQLNGRAVNQLIMHYHLHLMPRGADDPPLGASHCGTKPGDMDALKKTAEKIAAAIEA
ncbi:histidine triad domain protein [delta proteobacterium NaphS2]|nr:histidine triad domain protein [delta proteobacterium NaphS2]